MDKKNKEEKTDEAHFYVNEETIKNGGVEAHSHHHHHHHSHSGDESGSGHSSSHTHSHSSHSHSSHSHSSHSHSHSHTSGKRRKSVYSIFQRTQAKIANDRKVTRSHNFIKKLKGNYSRMSKKKKRVIMWASVACFAAVIVCVVLLIVNASHKHVYSDWIVTEFPTAEANGSAYRYCSCGERQTKTVYYEQEYSYASTDIFTGISTFQDANSGESITRESTHEELGLPVVRLTGDLSNVSSENADFDISYDSETLSFSCKCILKYQGSSTFENPKKNYTVKLRDEEGNKYKVEMADGWGKHSKYCLKANYCDPSQLRNIGAAKLCGQAAKTLDVEDEYSSLFNCGLIDGFPCVVYINGEFQGLYCFNAPKDEWLFDMDDNSETNAILFSKNWSLAGFLDEPLGYDIDNYGFSVEYCNTQYSNWAVDSFNNMSLFLRSCTYDTFITGADEYINIPRSIDTLISTWVFNGEDNTGKNIMWSTYDGKRWCPTLYDLDLTFGLSNYGKTFLTESTVYPGSRTSVLNTKLQEYMWDDISERYKELRGSVYSYENIEKTLEEIDSLIPEDIRKADAEKWPDAYNVTSNNLTQILSFTKKHLEYIDSFFE